MAWGLIVHEIWGEGGEVVENVVLIMLHEWVIMGEMVVALK